MYMVNSCLGKQNMINYIAPQAERLSSFFQISETKMLSLRFVNSSCPNALDFSCTILLDICCLHLICDDTTMAYN